VPGAFRVESNMRYHLYSPCNITVWYFSEKMWQHGFKPTKKCRYGIRSHFQRCSTGNACWPINTSITKYGGQW